VDYILDVNESDFDQLVIEYSHHNPVIVDFWAEWCAPCKVLGPILENEATKAGGSFRLAKVNVDLNPNLAMRYKVQSIPSVKAFKNGSIISEFLGAQPEPQVRNFIKKLVPNQSDLLLEKADSQYIGKDYLAAQETYNNILVGDANNPQALLGLVKCQIRLNQVNDANKILNHFPASRESANVERLLPLVQALFRSENMDFYDPMEAAFGNCIRLVTLGNIEAALDGFLGLLRQDKHYKNDEVHKIILGLFELLDQNDPQTRSYRNELASILF